MRILFLGNPDYTRAFLDCLSACGEVAGVITAADKQRGRGRAVQRPAPALWAEERAVPLFQAPDFRDARFMETLLELAPDLGVVVAYGRILPRAVFALPKHETINVHFSLLPAYRGASPIEAALLGGESKSGVSVQRIVEELDAGDVLASKEVTIEALDHYPELFAKLMNAALELLPRCIQSIEAGTAMYTPQAARHASFCKKIDAEARRIDWNKSAEWVYNQIRAYSGFRTAWTLFRGKKLLIRRARPVPAEECGELPEGVCAGGIFTAGGGKVFAACGNGKCLAPVEVQAEGKQCAPIAAWANGVRLGAGERFE